LIRRHTGLAIVSGLGVHLITTAFEGLLGLTAHLIPTIRGREAKAAAKATAESD
jgi:hypothetical protein